MVKDSKDGSAYTLHKKMDDLREGLMAQLKDAKEKAGVDLPLHPIPPIRSDGEKKDWEHANFGEGIPMAAAMTALVKIQSDAKNAENEVVKKILIEAEETSVNLDKFDAVAVAPSSYVLVGQPFTADVFLTAYDSHLSPNITVGGSSIPVADGKGKYNGSTSSEGLHTWTATISFKDNDGNQKTYTTPSQTYMVARPSAVVSPEKMNVMYIGVPNPVAVSAPGVANKDLVVTMTGGTIKPVSDGHFIATVSSLGTATVTVSGQLTKGKTSVLGSSTFRIKNIPDPKPMFAGKSGGTTSAANIKNQDFLVAKLVDFEFDARFDVKRFSVYIIKPRQDVIALTNTGAQLSPSNKATFAGITPGTRVIFDQIIAVGPDGRQRFLDPITFTAN
jgi:gliding motility-associated protein GldM